MKNRICLVFFFLCLLSCGRDKNSNSTDIQETDVNPDLHVIDVEKAERVDEILLSEFCSQMKTIILETNEDVLIGYVGGIQVYKDLIFVLNTSSVESLFAFSKEGKFIRKYGNRGIGPGEYLSIRDFTIDPENEHIYVLDDEADQVLIYEIFTGRYVNKIKLEEKAISRHHIQYNNEKLYTDITYWRNHENGCIIQEIDLITGKQKQCWLDAKRYNNNWLGGLGRIQESFFYARDQDACKYVHYFMDTIISIGKNQIMPYAVLKDKDWISLKDLAKIKEDIKEDSGLIYQIIEEKGLAYNIHSYLEWGDFISFKYIKRDKFLVLHNTKTGKTRISISFTNDLGYDRPWFSDGIICSDENGLYELIDAFYMERYLERIKEEGLLKKDVDKYEQLRTLSEDTNPILFYYEFKKEQK